jgi:hypothetical protein
LTDGARPDDDRVSGRVRDRADKLRRNSLVRLADLDVFGLRAEFCIAILTIFGVRTRDATATKSIVLYVSSSIARAK